jgi:uncharacterized BrkB/YihY/UPF0761 family membrane protein
MLDNLLIFLLEAFFMMVIFFIGAYFADEIEKEQKKLEYRG